MFCHTKGLIYKQGKMRMPLLTQMLGFRVTDVSGEHLHIYWESNADEQSYKMKVNVLIKL